MSNKNKALHLDRLLAGVEAFGRKYDYDVDYMRHILRSNPGAYEVFDRFLPMAGYRNAAPRDAFAVAKITAFRINDCGSCLQLTVKMALEEGIDPEIVRGALGDGAGLEPELRDVQRFVQSLSAYDQSSNNLREKMRSRYGDAALAEIALAVAAAAVFPTIKRVLGYFHSCERVEVAV